MDRSQIKKLVVFTASNALFLTTISFFATQYLADKANYHASLGENFYGLYAPFSWIIWAFNFWNIDQKLFMTISCVVILLSSIFLLITKFAIYGGRLKKGIKDLHGSAAWATRKEIVDYGLINDKPREEREGVYIGAWNDRGKTSYLRNDGPEHVLVYAPTGSGKGVGLVLPTLLSWKESAVILDIKGENFALSGGWRKKYAKNKVLKFDPSAVDGSSVKFNPLEEIRLETDHEVSDVQNIVNMIVDPDGKGLNDHWSKTGSALLVGTVLHVMYTKKEKGETATLQSVAAALSDPSRSVEEFFNEMLATNHVDGEVHPVVAESARDMLNKAENERSGVLSTAMSFLILYRDPIVAKNTSCSEFKIRDLMNHKNPVSLFLVVRPSDKDRLKPLIRLIINQIVRILCEKMDFKDGSSVKHYKHRLLLLIDEFPSLGKLEIFEESLAFIRGFGIKAYLITQDLSQLYKHYSKDESIMSNCHIRIAYAPNKIETAKLLSQMTGESTIIKKVVNKTSSKGIFSSPSYSESYQEVKRPLLTPDECMTLKGAKKDKDGKIVESGDMLIFVAGQKPIKGKQILYFKDPVLMRRAQIKPPAKSDKISA